MQAGTEADVWGCGCVLFAMLGGAIPFPERGHAGDDRAAFEAWAWWEYPLPEAFPHDAKDLVHRALQKKDARIRVVDIQHHRWLLQLEEDAAAETEVESDA